MIRSEDTVTLTKQKQSLQSFLKRLDAIKDAPAGADTTQKPQGSFVLDGTGRIRMNANVELDDAFYSILRDRCNSSWNQVCPEITVGEPQYIRRKCDNLRDSSEAGAVDMCRFSEGIEAALSRCKHVKVVW